MSYEVLIEVSGRHVHLCKADLNILFGKEHELRKLRDISQPGQFSCEEVVEVESMSGEKVDDVRVIGPLRSQTYVEFSMTDLFQLKMKAPLMIEPDFKKEVSDNLIIRGPKGEIRKSVAIVKQRHIHCDQEMAQNLKIKSGDAVKVEIDGDRKLIFDNVIARVTDASFFCCHLDTDEANAAGVSGKTWGNLIIEGKEK